MCLSKGTMETQASLAFYERWHASTWNFVLLVFPSQDIWFSQQPRICFAPILADHQAQQTILHHQTIPDLTHLSSYYPHIQINNQLKLYWYKNARVGSRFKSEHLCVAFFLGCQPFIYQSSIHRAAASAPSSFCQSITSKAAIIALFGPNRYRHPQFPRLFRRKPVRWLLMADTGKPPKLRQIMSSTVFCSSSPRDRWRGVLDNLHWFCQNYQKSTHFLDALASLEVVFRRVSRNFFVRYCHQGMQSNRPSDNRTKGQ